MPFCVHFLVCELDKGPLKKSFEEFWNAQKMAHDLLVICYSKACWLTDANFLMSQLLQFYGKGEIKTIQDLASKAEEIHEYERITVGKDSSVIFHYFSTEFQITNSAEFIKKAGKKDVADMYMNLGQDNPEDMTQIKKESDEAVKIYLNNTREEYIRINIFFLLIK